MTNICKVVRHTNYTEEDTVYSSKNSEWNRCKQCSKFPFKKYIRSISNLLRKMYFEVTIVNQEKSPNMEKKIMNPAEICMTLLLPILVEPRSPTFSLFLQNIFNFK